ncbi:MAG TPA: 2-amino-4-hydroxy-6-hydroxymethyldihydropteridine diphosphokinase [Ktedonobacterales bacterium]|nr:2-amino-4-hydroxy-6-hydroxymethyldihydropteridine diphosphokinase [Ktedonobacterales bacterium]
MTGRELLRLHIDAVWSLTLPTLDETLDEFVLTHGFPAWPLYLGVFAHEEVALWRPDVTPEQRTLYLENAHKADAVWDHAPGMRREVVFHAPHIRQEQLAQAQRQARMLNAEDADLVNAFEADSASYFLQARTAPCVGVVVNGQLVSIAHSPRQTSAACELGINTLPEARRQGYAIAATTLWTAIVQQKGLIPIYSAFAWNTASLQLAKAVGYTPGFEGIYGPMQEPAPHVVYLGLGSNLGDRDASLRAALVSLAAPDGESEGGVHPIVQVERVSSVYDTAPMLMTEQPRFHNIACMGRTWLGPVSLLYALKRIEVTLGRTSDTPRYGPRVIDIDILLYDDLSLRSPELTIPHEQLAERAFALAPLAEIAPDVIHPTLGRTTQSLAASVTGQDVRRVGKL